MLLHRLNSDFSGEGLIEIARVRCHAVVKLIDGTDRDCMIIDGLVGDIVSGNRLMTELEAYEMTEAALMRGTSLKKVIGDLHRFSLRRR